MPLKPSSFTQRRVSRTASMGRAMFTDPIPASRSGAWLTKDATSSLEIRSPPGPHQAEIRLLLTPALSCASVVMDTGNSVSEAVTLSAWLRVQRRSESSMG